MLPAMLLPPGLQLPVGGEGRFFGVVEREESVVAFDRCEWGVVAHEREPGAAPAWCRGKRLRRRLADGEMRHPRPKGLLHAARYSCSRLGCGCQ